MNIGHVAEQLGIPASTIRYYEKVGLIERQNRVSGRRNFDDRALVALRFVRIAQAAGFTIAEIKSLLDSYTRDPSPAGLWKPFAETKQKLVKTSYYLKLTLSQEVFPGNVNDCIWPQAVTDTK